MRRAVTIPPVWIACGLFLAALIAGPVIAAEANRETAAALFGVPAETIAISPSQGVPLAQRIDRDGKAIGYLASTWEVARSAGYSGRPIDILVAVDTDGIIRGTRIVSQNEPILTIGISSKQLEDYVATFIGTNATKSIKEIGEASRAAADGITGATLSSAVICDGIIRTARTVVQSRTVRTDATARIDLAGFAPATWTDLLAEGAVAGRLVTNAEVSTRLPAAVAATPEDTFIDLYAAIANPAAIGQNLLGRRQYEKLITAIDAKDAAILVAARGLYSFKGTAWRKSGKFDRIQIVQGPRTYTLTTDGYRNVDRLAPPDAPEFRELGLFVLPAASGFDPAQPWRLSLLVERNGQAGPVSAVFDLPYRLPDRLLTAPSASTATTSQADLCGRISGSAARRQSGSSSACF